MYSDEVEESLNEEIIKIIMQDQSSENIEPVRMITPIPPQRPPEMVILSNTPSPRCSPYPSPSHSPYPSPFHSPCPSPRPSSPLHSINGLKTSNQTEKLSPSTAINSQRYTPAPEHVQPLQTKPHGIACDSKKPTSNPSADVQEEDSKKTEKNSGPKFDSSTSSSSKAAIFRSRLFGLQYTGASESPTLPPTSKATSSNNACTTSSSNTSNLYLFAEPPMSPATISNSPFPPSEPLELQYFECDEVKMRHLVNKMSHANVCPADTCTELCVYIKWYANHRKSCTKLYNKGKCEHCHKFIQWQYQHCINCKCFPHKGCSDNISWCPQIKQSILKNKLESCIAPLVRKLQNGFHLDKENSCPRHNTIEKCHPEGYHEVLKEHLQFNVGGGMFVEGKHWKRNKRAGRGRSGSCWIAELIECPFYFAVKEARLDSSTQAKRNLDEAYCSVKMKYLNQHVCPNIIDYYGFTTVRLNAHPFVEPPPMLLQIHMELMACCLQSFVTDKDKNGPLLFDKVVDFSYQLFSALDFLHSNLRILHRDIKPGNILVAHNEQRIKLTDFDCAALLDEWNLCDVFQGDPQGTVHYNPPEEKPQEGTIKMMV